MLIEGEAPVFVMKPFVSRQNIRPSSIKDSLSSPNTAAACVSLAKFERKPLIGIRKGVMSIQALARLFSSLEIEMQ